MNTYKFKCNPYQTMAEDMFEKAKELTTKALLTGYYGHYNEAVECLRFVKRLCKNEDLVLPDGFEAVADSLIKLEKLL